MIQNSDFLTYIHLNNCISRTHYLVTFAIEGHNDDVNANADHTQGGVNLFHFASMVFTASASEQPACIGDAVTRYLLDRSQRRGGRRTGTSNAQREGARGREGDNEIPTTSHDQQQRPQSAASVGESNMATPSRHQRLPRAQRGLAADIAGRTNEEQHEHQHRSSASRGAKEEVYRRTSEEQARDERQWVVVRKLRRSVKALVELLPEGSVKQGFKDLIPPPVKAEEEVGDTKLKPMAAETTTWKSMQALHRLHKERHVLASLEKRLGIAVSMVGGGVGAGVQNTLPAPHQSGTT
jgi:hypothetical protein